jgi:hypothetical protein
MPRYQLTDAEREMYRERGYVLIPDFLSPDELELWRRGVDGAVADRGPLGGGAVRLPVAHPELENLPQDIEQWKTVGDEKSYDKVFTQRLNLWMTNPIMRDLMLCPGLGEMVTELASEHMPEIEGMRIWCERAHAQSSLARLRSAACAPAERDAAPRWVAQARPDADQGALGQRHRLAHR